MEGQKLAANWRPLLRGCFLATLLSCASSDSTAPKVQPPPQVANVTVALPRATLRVGETLQAAATLVDANGAALVGRQIVWTSSSEVIARVSSSGLVTAVAPGTATITATSEGKAGSAALTVTVVPVASISVALPRVTIRVGETVQASATPLDSAGVTLIGRQLVWSSSDNGVAAVNATGLVTAVAPGTATIIATSEGKAGSAALTVTVVPVASISVALPRVTIRVGETVQASATLLDSAGGLLSGRQIAWSSSNTEVAAANGAGLATAIAPGTANITASAEGKTGNATLTVTVVPVATLVIIPNTGSVTVGQALALTAIAKDSAGNALTGRTVVWVSSDSTIATVTVMGLVKGVRAGAVSIVAVSEGSTAAAAITVTTAPQNSLAFDGTGYVRIPHSATLAITGVFTIETWVKVDPANTADFNDFLSKQALSFSFSGFGFRVNNGTNLTAGVVMSSPAIVTRGVGDPAFTASTLKGVWQHVALVWDGRFYRSFLNGRLISETEYPAGTTPDFTTNPLHLGSQYGTFRPFTGKLAEVRVSSVARYAELFTPSVSLTSDPDTRALWFFGGDTGNTVVDRSGNGNSGIITGGVTRSLDVPTSVPTVGPPTATFRWAGNGQTGAAGQALPIEPAIQVKEANGQPVAGIQVSFSVTGGGGTVGRATATTNEAGTASAGTWTVGQDGGPQSLAATVQGITATTFTATSPAVAAAPAITSVAPSTLIPGTSVTLVGTNFSTTGGGNTLTIGGATASVISASTTQITATVPCVASGIVPVVVSVGGLSSNSVNASLAGNTKTLAVGQSVILTSNATSLCNELPSAGAARYLITVFSSSTSQNALADFELGGNPVSPSVVNATLLAPLRSKPVAFQLSEDEQRDRAHFEHLERGRALFQQLRGTARAISPAPSTGVATALPAVGDQRTLYYNYNCADTTKLISARALYIGTRAVIWEDTTNTLLSTTDAPLASYYQRLGQIFDQDQYDVIRTNFGDPLRRDPLTDGDGRVHMVFTQRVNQQEGVAAFVTFCDQYPRTAASFVAASNFGEFFYSFVPTLVGASVNDTRYPDGWFSFINRTMVHEVKHIASLAARVANNAASFEASWLEEGTARHAEELWVRSALHNSAWKANTGYGSAASNGVFCDFNAGNATCLANDVLRRPSWGMRRPFNEIRPKLLEPWNWSPYGDGTGQAGSVFYNTVWSLVRYAIDRYGISDASFLGALTNSTSIGITNLTAVAGVGMDQLIGGWGLALFADDYPGLVSPGADIMFSTWNLRDIYRGLYADPAWTTRWNSPFPIQPTQLTFGSFTAQQTGVRGGAQAYFELSGTSTGPQILHLRAIGGGQASPVFRMSIARLQ